MTAGLYKRTPETLKKMRISHLGKKWTEEMRRNYIKAKTGKSNNGGIKRMGEKNGNWISNRTLIIGRHNRDFHDPEYKQWRKNVCNRDDWKCKIDTADCKGRLEVHHILGWKNHPELRYEVNNGITLCHFHHPRKRKDEMKLSPYFKELIKM